MWRKNVIFSLLFFAVFLSFAWFSSTANAFQVQATAPQIGNIAVRWNKPVIPILLHQDGAPGIKDGSDIRALRKAFQAWAAPSCNNLKFDIQLTTITEFAGRKQDPEDPLSAPRKDGKSVVRFESKKWEFGDQVIVKNATFFAPKTGELQETDLLFNAVHFKWSANAQANTLDIMTVALPRIGQMIGLWYSDVEDSVMHPSFDLRGIDHSLRQDDINGSCFLYPTAGWKNAPPPKPGTTKPKPPKPEPTKSDAGTTPQPNPDTSTVGNNDQGNTSTTPPSQNTGCQIGNPSTSNLLGFLILFFFLSLGWRKNQA